MATPCRSASGLRPVRCIGLSGSLIRQALKAGGRAAAAPKPLEHLVAGLALEFGARLVPCLAHVLNAIEAFADRSPTTCYLRGVQAHVDLARLTGKKRIANKLQRIARGRRTLRPFLLLAVAPPGSPGTGSLFAAENTEARRGRHGMAGISPPAGRLGARRGPRSRSRHPSPSDSRVRDPSRDRIGSALRLRVFAFRSSSAGSETGTRRRQGAKRGRADQSANGCEETGVNAKEEQWLPVIDGPAKVSNVAALRTSGAAENRLGFFP